MELRVYQNNEVIVHVPEPEDILQIMEHIQYLDKILLDYDKEGV
jgi:hypothetical protein